MKHSTYWLAILTVTLNAPRVQAASGTEGASFLDIPVGARPAALGSAYSPLASDVYATLMNPAGLGFLQSTELAGQHLNYLESIDDEYVGAAFPIRSGQAVGLSVQYLGSGDIPSTDNNGNAIGNFSSHFAAYSLGYGQTVSEQFSLGATAKWIHEKIGDFNANAYGGSVGAMYRPMDQLSFSAVVDNFGSRLTFIDNSDPLPLTGRLGAAYSPSAAWTFALEGDYAQTGLASAHTGVEWKPLESVALRVGYRSDTVQQLSPFAGFSTGIGVSLWGSELSYAWLPMSDLGNTQYFSLVVRFGRENEKRRNLIYYPSIHNEAEHTREQPSSEDLEEIIRLISAPSDVPIASAPSAEEGTR